jgi:hypothetical protein
VKTTGQLLVVSKQLPMRYKISLFIFILLAVILTKQEVHAVSTSDGPSMPTVRQRSQASDESTDPFAFHNGFWINLHHFLYEQAAERKKPGSSGSAAGVDKSQDKLTPEQMQLWNAALDYYTNAVIKHDLLQDRDMATMNDALSLSEAEPDLARSGVNADLSKVLESVAPIYRARWWPQHERANRFWIAMASPMVKQFGPMLIKQLTAAYREKWPATPIRVDVVEYANWAGAYTTIDRNRNVHTTICSIETDYQAFSALEMLFHEASHSMVDPRNGAVAEAIARECQARSKPIPGGLWHAIIFYTAGDFTKRDLKELGVMNYTPSGYRGLYARAWPNLQKPLELYWQPYLDGKVDFDKAISSLIDAL